MKLRRMTLVLLCVIFLSTGLYVLYDVLDHLGADVIAQHEEKLEGVADSVDISAENLIFICKESLAYVAERRGFRNAETILLETGDETELLLRIQENLLMQGLQADNFLALDETGILMSATGSTNYRFPESAEDLFLCTDDAGIWFLGIQYRKPQIRYVVLIELTDLCEKLAEGSSITNTERLLLIDRDNRAIICFREGTTTVHPLTEEVLEKSPERRIAYEANNTAIRQVDRLVVEEPDGTSIMGYGLIGSQSSRNGLFTICILDTYDGHLQHLREKTIWIIISLLVILAGFLLAISYVSSLTRENRQNTRELERLKQREAALEKINQQTQQLAHHQRLETIGTLTSSISHEFNNLLTPIMSYSLLTLEKLPDEEEELYDNVLEIYTASQKAKTIISRLSDLSRKNSTVTFRDTSIDALVKKSLEIAMPAKPEQVAVKLNLNCWDLRIRANEIQLTQMLLNLILNAFQAMAEGGTLEIVTTFDDHYVHIHMTDTGCGIPEEIRGKIFDPFFTTKEAGKGTGLGLAIVAQVVEDHQGSITVSDNEGHGSVFHVCLSRNVSVPV